MIVIFMKVRSVISLVTFNGDIQSEKPIEQGFETKGKRYFLIIITRIKYKN